jgi:hypothetical protein
MGVNKNICKILGFHHCIVEAFTLLGCYAAYGDCVLLKFQGGMGLMGCPEMPVTSYQLTPHNMRRGKT